MIITCTPYPLSHRMLLARIACKQAQARLDALSGDPAALAWVEVMDALRECAESEATSEA
jgi:hypothetical protein